MVHEYEQRPFLCLQNLTVEYEMKLEKLDRRGGELHQKYRKILVSQQDKL